MANWRTDHPWLIPVDNPAENPYGELENRSSLVNPCGQSCGESLWRTPVENLRTDHPCGESLWSLQLHSLWRNPSEPRSCIPYGESLLQL